MRTSFGDERRRIDESIVFTQPDLPEPVVPATSRCGIFARSVQTELPAMSLPSHTDSGEPDGGPPCSPRSRRKMSPRYTIRWRLLGTSTPTACLPGMGARMRMSVDASA